MERHYEILGVSSDASLSTIRQRYRTLLTEHHPDQGGTREEFLKIKRAYEEVTGERAPESPDTGESRRTELDPEAPTFDIEATDRASGLSVSGDLLTLTLVGIADSVDVTRLTDAPGNSSSLDRTVACFEVRNAGTEPCHWRGRSETRFIGTDGFMYEASTVLSPGKTSLPEDWWPGTATLDPGTGLRSVVVAGELPDDVTIDRVVYTHHGSDPSGPTTERYLFEIDKNARRLLSTLPFDVS